MLFEYETSKINQQVKRNPNKFLDDFMFQITKNNHDVTKYDIRWGGTRKFPHAFSELYYCDVCKY